MNVRNAAYGAKGDGVTDDTAAIQRAVNAVAGTGGTVMIPDGTYMVNPIAVSNVWGLRLGSNMTLSLTSGAHSKGNHERCTPITPSLAWWAAAMSPSQGGTITGDRSTHTGTTGEWGMGVYVGTNSTNITIRT